MRKKLIFLLLVLISLCAFSIGIYVHFENETIELREQERLSELAAEEYLVSVFEQETSPNESTLIDNDDLDYNDNEIYSYFTEDGAWGHIDSVLEIPAIELRQTIYSGTPEQIEHDLGYWLPVTARADYILGDTHYCIYIHNPSDRSLKISRAQFELNVGDYMVLTQGANVFLYEVTSVFPEWRNKCTTEYVDNMAIDREMLYIFTCGLDDWAGRNVVIEGKINKVFDVQDWTKNKEEYIAEYKSSVSSESAPAEKDTLVLTITTKDEKVIASLTNAQYTQVKDCTIGICDKDGQLIPMEQNPIPFNGEDVLIPQLDEGEYYVGVHDCPAEYENPTPYKLVINTEQHSQKITSLAEEVQNLQQQTDMMKFIAIAMVGMTILLGTITVLRIFHKSKN